MNHLRLETSWKPRIYINKYININLKKFIALLNNVKYIKTSKKNYKAEIIYHQNSYIIHIKNICINISNI